MYKVAKSGEADFNGFDNFSRVANSIFIFWNLTYICIMPCDVIVLKIYDGRVRAVSSGSTALNVMAL